MSIHVFLEQRRYDSFQLFGQRVLMQLAGLW